MHELAAASADEAGRASEVRTAFTVVDVLGGFASLVKRSATLDGSVPVRVARACVPLLEGNAWGFQIALRDRLVFKRRLGGWSVDGLDDATRLLRATVPMLVADGTLRDGNWRKRLERGVVDTRGGLSVFTGLFVQPHAGVRLRQASTSNRRSYDYTIREAILDDSTGLVPVILDLDATRDSFVLAGEIATLAALPSAVQFHTTDLAHATGPRDAHLAFYDRDYFATKKRGDTARSYRDDIVRHQVDAADDAPVTATIVEAGPRSLSLASPSLYHRADGPSREALALPCADRIVFTNAVELAATFDGQHVTVSPDKDQLAAYAREVAATWKPYAPPGTTDPWGALLYLSKYVTPHPPGEPHFFVKPSALLATSPGTSTVIDGDKGHPDFDVLRGVVASDAFHATPAVFHLRRPGETFTVAAGYRLAELFPVPRRLIDAGFRFRAGGVAARLA